MKALTLWQPHASAMFVKLPDSDLMLKNNETRDWEPPADCIGQRMAICSAKSHKPRDKDGEVVDLHAWWMKHVKRNPVYALAFWQAGYDDWTDLPFGCVLGHGIIRSTFTTGAAMLQNRVSKVEQDWGNYDLGRVAWAFTDMVKFPKPIPVTGRQGIFNWEEAA